MRVCITCNKEKEDIEFGSQFRNKVKYWNKNCYPCAYIIKTTRANCIKKGVRLCKECKTELPLSEFIGKHNTCYGCGSSEKVVGLGSKVKHQYWNTIITMEIGEKIEIKRSVTNYDRIRLIKEGYYFLFI